MIIILDELKEEENQLDEIEMIYEEIDDNSSEEIMKVLIHVHKDVMFELDITIDEKSNNVIVEEVVVAVDYAIFH